ncbi:MAG: methionyl-tRNA formyltransferase [Phycisphaerae bacterium]|jgi:methionyl-tRNA formyltransferase
MRIVFLGTGDFAVPALHAVCVAGHEVLAAISQPDRPAGRGRAVVPTPVHAAADELHIRHVQTEDVNAPELVETLRAGEIGVVAAFGQKIGPELLAAVSRGFVNIHGSLLPRYRGAAPFQWAVLNGETETGVTVFQLDQRWDTGPIWGRKTIAIGEAETADELHDRLAVAGAELIVPTLAQIEAGTAEPQPQDASLACRAPKLSKADGRVDFAEPAARVVRRILGLWSWPSAACTFVSRTGRRERLQLARARVADVDAAPDEQHRPGAFHADGTVQTGAGRVALLEVKPAGGKLMPFAAFANGRQVAPPDRLDPPEST